jgi:hypothetical protein
MMLYAHSKCHDLAEYFAENHDSTLENPVPPKEVEALALAIQTAVEEWLTGWAKDHGDER